LRSRRISDSKRREASEYAPLRESGSFEVLEHTADAGIVATGATVEEVFGQAAKGMYSLMVDLRGVREIESRDIQVEGKDLAGLLTAWLVELLLLTDTEDLLFSRFDVKIDGGRLQAEAFGEPADASRHELRGMVKGVTRHLLDVGQTAEGYRARVLFDM